MSNQRSSQVSNFLEKYEVSIQTQTIPLGSDLLAYRTVQVGVGPNPSQAKLFDTNAKYGIVSVENFKKVVTQQLALANAAEPVYYLPSALISDANILGISNALQIWSQQPEKQKELLSSESIFNLAIEGKTDLFKNLYKAVDREGEVFVDSEQHYVQQGLCFSYISGNIDNAQYDLHALLKHLQANAQVKGFDSAIFKEIVRGRKPVSTEMPLTISQIPYYNVTESCSSQIQFLFLPTETQFKEIIDFTRGHKRYISFIAAILELDMLDIKQFLV